MPLDLDDLKVWKHRLTLSKKKLDRIVPTWDRFKRYYQNQYYEEASRVLDKTSVNYVFSNIKTIIPAIYARDPYILVHARRPEDLKKSKVKEILINYQLHDIGFKQQMQEILLDAQLAVGYCYLGYLLELNAMSKDALPTEFNEVIQHESVFAVRKSPKEVFWPIDAKNEYEARWVIIRHLKHLDDLRRDRRFENTKTLKPSSTIDEGWMKEVYTNQDLYETREKEDDARVILYEIFDKVTNRQRFFAEGHDKWLRNEPNPYTLLEGFPIVKLGHSSVPDELLPLPEVASYEPQQLEMNAIRTQMIMHFKRLARKFIIQKGTWDREDLDNIRSPEDGVLVEVDNMNAIKVLEQATIPADTYNVEALIKQDVNILSGVNEIQRSQIQGRRTTATETFQRDALAKMRAGYMMDQVNEFVGKVATKVLQLDAQFLDTEKVIRYLGPKGEAWVTIDPEDLKGEFDIDVQAGSSAPVDKELRFKNWVDMWNLSANAVDHTGRPLIDREKVLEHMFEELGVEAESVLLKHTQVDEPLGGLPSGIGGTMPALPGSRIGQELSKDSRRRAATTLERLLANRR